MKEVGYAWQRIKKNPQERQYFQDKANNDKGRYVDEQRNYYDEVERIGKEIGTVKKKDGHVNVAGKPDEQNKLESKRLAKIQQKILNKEARREAEFVRSEASNELKKQANDKQKLEQEILARQKAARKFSFGAPQDTGLRQLKSESKP